MCLNNKRTVNILNKIIKIYYFIYFKWILYFSFSYVYLICSNTMIIIFIFQYALPYGWYTVLQLHYFVPELIFCKVCKITFNRGNRRMIKWKTWTRLGRILVFGEDRSRRKPYLGNKKDTVIVHSSNPLFFYRQIALALLLFLWVLP